jgi:hypothetical protein
MKHTIARIFIVGSVSGGALIATNAAAIEWNVTGFVRQEIAYSLSGRENENNHNGNPWNNRINPHITHAGFGTNAGTPFTDFNSTFANSNAPTALYVDPDGNAFGGVGGMFASGFAATAQPGFVPGTLIGLPAGANTANAVDCHFNYQRALAAGPAGGAGGFGPRVLSDGLATFASNSFGGVCPAGLGGFVPDSDAFLAGDKSRGKHSRNFNLFNSRVEVDVQANISSEFSAYMKIRGYFDGTRNFTDAKTGDHFGNPMWGNRRGTITEWNSPDSIIDIPALYLDWNRGPLWLRLGNQVIAWGEAYFFRTMDVANGLDLRRHLVLGPGAEEYQDQRIASPGIRLSYSFNNAWELDAFAQLWSPTLLPGENTPYNLVKQSGGRLDDSAGMDDAKGAWNFGARMTMPFTESFTGIIGYVNRRSQDGVFRSVDAPTFWAGAPNSGCLNNYNDTLNVLAGPVGGAFFGGVNPGFGSGSVAGVQSALGATGFARFPTLNTRGRTMENGCGSAFAPDPRGTPSVQYWDTIAKARLDNGHYLRQVIDEFPAAKWAVRDIFGFGQEQNFADTYRTLEGFRSSFGPFIQWVGREFKREQVFMIGGNYVVSSDNEWLDQLIVRGEVAVTPNKRLTNDLSFDFTKKDDIISALIFEKYQRLSDAFPATYMVAQWMHRTATDMFGRDLDKNGTPSISKFIDPVTGNFTAAAFDPDAMKPDGNSNANYVVFAFQQPFPNLIWRFDMAVLVDVAGGYLVQPGVRYRPAANWQWDIYANVIASPGGDNDTITETLDFADEIFARLTYFF